MVLRGAVCCVLAVCVFVVDAAQAQILSEVVVSGNERVEAETILLRVKSKAGDTLDLSQVEQDVKELFRTGFFDHVAVRREQEGERVRLVFDVIEKPAIRNVRLVGNESVKDETLKERLNIDARRFFDRRKLRAGIQAVKNYYESKGYYGTEVELREVPLDGNEVDLEIRITEGKKRYISEIVFEGNVGADADELRDVMKTSEYSWWSSWITGSGVVNPEQLQNDVRELQKFYLNRGYVDVKIAEPVVDVVGENLRLTIRISEGEVYRFGDISAKGTLLDESENRTLEGVEAKSGELFSIDTLRKDTFTISEKFTDIGYAFANVEPETTIRRAERLVDVVFRIDKGTRVTVNRIEMSGNKKTADNVIRRTLKIHEQEIFSSSKIRRSQELLRRLGYFDEVAITPESTPHPDEVNLNVAVKEASTGSFSIGAGISSGEGFIATARIAENNLFGTGNSLAFDVNTGTERNNYVISFDNPRVSDTYWSFGVDLLSTERRYDDFDRGQRGAAVSVGHPLDFLGEEYRDDYRFSLRYQLLAVEISNVDEDASRLVKENEGKSTASSIAPRLIRNTIDNPLDPERGSRQTGEIELAGLGGDEEFYLLNLSSTFYYPLLETSFGNFVFSQRTRFSYGETFNGEDFPLFKRFFPGGINSVRGFESRSLGPKDEEGNEYGGSKELIMNFELILPLLKEVGLKGLMFYDAGEAFDDDEGIKLSELRQAAGFGIRWRSPLAPIRIEFGWPLDREEGDKSFVTNFSFGAPL